MKVRRVIHRQIRHSGEGLQIAADVNAVISANVDEQPPPAREPDPPVGEGEEPARDRRPPADQG